MSRSILIVLTKYRESIRALGDNRQYVDDICLGQHEICNGFMDCEQVSKTHRALICRKCKLRVVIPREIKTWEQLKAYCKQALKEGE